MEVAVLTCQDYCRWPLSNPSRRVNNGGGKGQQWGWEGDTTLYGGVEQDEVEGFTGSAAKML